VAEKRRVWGKGKIVQSGEWGQKGCSEGPKGSLYGEILRKCGIADQGNFLWGDRFRVLMVTQRRRDFGGSGGGNRNFGDYYFGEYVREPAGK